MTDVELSSGEIELLERIIAGELSLRKIDSFVNEDRAVMIRREALALLKNVQFEHIGHHTLDIAGVTKRNIENMIGAVQIPLGVAGPLKARGDFVNEEVFLPLATTEGALVASVNRGCSAINAAGGCNVAIFQDVMTRAPVFKLEDLKRTREFFEWVQKPEVLGRMREKAAETTRFGELLRVDPYVTGNTVFLRFIYDTKDAMGMNMVTIATDAVVSLIADEFGVVPVSISGNMCTDKKPALINSIMGRGKTVVADVVIPADMVRSKLKTTSDAMVDVNYRKNMLGSARAGSLGYNAHAANIIAAMFLSCGQDAAHVVEGSSAITTMELMDNGDLLCAVTLPSLQVGTVGGGTSIGPQKECLGLLGVAGPGEVPGSNAKKLAEIIACAVLAGEVSLIGAQAAGHLARAHAELGR